MDEYLLNYMGLALSRETIAVMAVAVLMNVAMYWLGRRDGYRETMR